MQISQNKSSDLKGTYNLEIRKSNRFTDSLINQKFN